jgi:hypothetical protein
LTSPGSDKIQNYRLKTSAAAHMHITKKLYCNNGGTREDTRLDGHKNILFTPEITRQQGDPVTCLTTMFKILIKITARRISTHLEEQSLLPAEQKGCPTGSKGNKHQLII